MTRAWRWMWLLYAASSVAGAQQMSLSSDPRANGPVNVPGWPSQQPVQESLQPAAAVASTQELPTDGRCQSVRYGDIVHFTLRIENVENAKAIFTDLQMGLGEHPKFQRASLRVPAADAMGGGGVGWRDARDPQLYHFRFEVPVVQPGFYHAAGADVRASYGTLTTDGGVGVSLSREARRKIAHYCIAVFGDGSGDHQPRVTDFLPGRTEQTSNLQDDSVFRQ